MARKAATAVVEDQHDPALDDNQENGQDYRSGQVSEEELALSRSVAKRLGWVPKEEWTRDPAKHVDAPEFLENTPREIETLKERLKRTGQAAADAIEDARRQARIEAQAEIRAAARDGDEEAAAKAAEKLAKVAGPPPQTQAWMARNSWFEQDEDARAIAVNEVNRLASQGASINDQLEAAEAKVRKRFPEYFETRSAPKEETRLSESRRSPPAVSPGSRNGSAAPKEKGFSDIPPGDRALFQKHFAKRYESYGLKPEDAQAKYAQSYWSNKGEA